MEVDTETRQDLNSSVAESTLRKDLAPLHEKKNGVFVHQILDAFLRGFRCFLHEILRIHESSRRRSGRQAKGRGGDKGMTRESRQREAEDSEG